MNSPSGRRRYIFLGWNVVNAVQFHIPFSSLQPPLSQNENYLNSKTLSSYVWKMKKTKKETSTLVWQIIWTVALYTNILERCFLCLHEKLAIRMCPSQSEFLNKRYELVSKCWYENKFLLQIINSNDWRKYLYSDFLESSKINVFIF